MKSLRVFYAWELGDNFGHLHRGYALARALRKRGHPVLFSVRNTAIAHRVLRGMHFVQAPVHIRSQPFARDISSYADILMASGYDNEGDLSGLLAAWLTQLRLFDANLVVADHSPTALIAARMLSIPAIALGTGFEIPPPVSPFPAFSVKNTSSQTIASDAIVLGTINSVLKKTHASEMESLSCIFAQAAVLLTTLPELDHYQNRNKASYIGPIPTGNIYRKIAWKSENSPKVVVYIRGNGELLKEVLSALTEISANAVCVFPGLKSLPDAPGPTISVHNSTINLQDLLMDADLVMTNGGSALCAESMLAGIPMLLLPLHDEQRMACARVVEAGAGLTIPPETQSGRIVEAMKSILLDKRFKVSAATIRDRNAGLRPGESIDQIVSIAEGLSKSVERASLPRLSRK